MAVWNIHDTKVINGVLGTVDQEGKPVPPKKEKYRSIADFVRVSASKQHWMERRAGSVPALLEEQEEEEMKEESREEEDQGEQLQKLV